MDRTVVVRHAVPETFLERALPWLVEHEAEHCVLLGAALALASAPPDADARRHPYLAVAGTGGDPAAAAIWMPGRGIVVSRATRAGAVRALAADAADRGIPIPAVEGPADVARAFAAAWTALTGQVTRRSMAGAVYELRRVRPPAVPAEGRPRAAARGDRALIAGWLVAFGREAVPDEPDPPDPLASADRMIGGPGRSLWLWETGGRPVSMASAAWPTPTGIRISGVYTPPEDRRRGFASALTAALSEAQLAGGRARCFLLTDLGNETSNAIYQRIGYVRAGTADRYLVDATGGHG